MLNSVGSFKKTDEYNNLSGFERGSYWTL